MDDLDDYFNRNFDRNYGQGRGESESTPDGEYKEEQRAYNYHKKRQKRGIVAGVLVLVFIAGAAIIYFEPPFAEPLIQDIKNEILAKVPVVNENISDVKEIVDDNVGQAGTVVKSALEGKSGFSSLEVENYIWIYTNEERQKHGLGPLSRVSEIDSIARVHSKDMGLRDYFEHHTPEGLDPTDRGERVGYTCVKHYETHYTSGLAENIFLNYTYDSYYSGIFNNYSWKENESALAHDIVEGWMDSPGHRKNILTETYDRIGVGVYITEDEAVYSTQNFC